MYALLHRLQAVIQASNWNLEACAADSMTMSGPPLVAATELAAWVRRVDDRRALNTIWGLRQAQQWRELPDGVGS